LHLQCSASTCKQTFHSGCSLALPNGDLVCSQQCFNNQSATVGTLAQPLPLNLCSQFSLFCIPEYNFF
jgi:hypothetical protein